MSKCQSRALSNSVEISEEGLGFARGIEAEPLPERIIESFELLRDDMFAGAPFSYNRHILCVFSVRIMIINKANW